MGVTKSYFCDKCVKPFPRSGVHDVMTFLPPHFDRRGMAQMCAPCRLALRKLVWNFFPGRKFK